MKYLKKLTLFILLFTLCSHLFSVYSRVDATAYANNSISTNDSSSTKAIIDTNEITIRSSILTYITIVFAAMVFAEELIS